MARSDGSTEEGITSTNGAPTAPEEKTKVNIVFGIPVDLKATIETDAKAANVPVGSFIRKMVADHYGYTLPAAQQGRARKYATAEERVAAQRAKQAERNTLIKKLLADYRAQAEAGTPAPV